MFICPHCGGECRMMVQATFVAPSNMYGKFSKKNLRRKDVYLMGVNWETADHLCNSCNVLVNDGYGNYVTRLKKENEELKLKLEALSHDSKV